MVFPSMAMSVDRLVIYGMGSVFIINGNRMLARESDRRESVSQKMECNYNVLQGSGQFSFLYLLA